MIGSVQDRDSARALLSRLQTSGVNVAFLQAPPPPPCCL